MSWRIAAVLILTLSAGCSFTLDFGAECTEDQGCAAQSRVCRSGYCVVPPAPDAAVPDAAVPDAANPDALVPDVGPDAMADAGTLDLGFPDALPLDTGLPPIGSTIVHTATITSSTRWSSDYVHELAAPIFVAPGARLVIEAGTTVRGRTGSALIVRAGAELEAVGTPTRPVVFTSARPVGQRAAGDWGGVALLGRAPVNLGEGKLEGVPPSDTRTAYGGQDPFHPCGVLRYVRIEFAGYRLYTNNELNALTLAGCGEGTVVEYVQTHRGLDDGIEVFGGTVSMSHLVVSRPGDDGLDWTQGWRGFVQFVIVQMGAEDGDAAVEADNEETRFDLEPRSNPQIYNVTLVGGGLSGSVAHRGMVLRRGTAGQLANVLLMGFSTEAIDVRDAATRDCFRGAVSCVGGPLAFRGLWMFDLGPGGNTYFASEADDDGGFDERTEIIAAGGVRLGRDPQLFAPYDVRQPSFQPTAGSPVGTATIAVAPPQGEGIDETARYLGAIRPGESAWTEGWTAFPEN